MSHSESRVRVVEAGLSLAGRAGLVSSSRKQRVPGRVGEKRVVVEVL